MISGFSDVKSSPNLVMKLSELSIHDQPIDIESFLFIMSTLEKLIVSPRHDLLRYNVDKDLYEGC